MVNAISSWSSLELLVLPPVCELLDSLVDVLETVDDDTDVDDSDELD